MTTQGGTFDEMTQTLQRKLALYHDRRVGFLDEFHVSHRLGPHDSRTREIALARKNEITAHRLDLDTVGDAVQIANNLLEIGGGHVDGRGVFDVGHFQLLRVGINEAQFLIITLFDVPVIVLETQVRYHPVVIIVFINIHGKRVVVRHGGNDLEQVEGVGTHDNFVGFAVVMFEFIRV